MTYFRDTNAADAFIATADSRNTSREVMQAIAFFARDANEAVALWEGDGFGRIAHLSDIWENATKNGLISDENLMWGDRTLAAIIAENAA